MKLDYKKTFYVGIAFFIICMFWQTYDTIVPKILIERFGMNQSLSGFIMALDNILALFLLPLFGHLSDKTKTKIGKRTPYIIIGTILAAVLFVGSTFADNIQLTKIEGITNNTTLVESGVLNEPTCKVSIKNEQTGVTEKYQILEAMDIKGLSIDDFKNLTEDDGEIFNDFVKPARTVYAWQKTINSPQTLIIFMVILLFVLLSMSVYRSPAVALMPDVTIKPLRSKANAVINLMGAFGGILVIVLGMAFKTDTPSNFNSYTAYFGTISALMILFLVLFLLKVKEPKLNREMQQDIIKYNIKEENEDENQNKKTEKMSKDKLHSLLFLLASVFLWFMGYNAVTSKFAVYADRVLNFGFNLPLMIAQISAIVCFIPIGIIASRVGRKKTILVGIIVLSISFFSAYFITTNSSFFMYIIFMLAGIGWATINVNSYPMVVEMSKGSDIGRYTGFYYTASMAAQILTPILSGILMDLTSMKTLFPYATLFSVLAFITMLMVKHGDNKPKAKKGLEAFDN